MLGLGLRSHLRDTTYLALPLVGAQFLHMAMVFTDTVMLGHLGTDSLAAMGIGGPYYSLCWIACFGIVSALNTKVSQSFGAGRIKDIPEYFSQALWISLFLFVLVLAWLSFGTQAMTWLGQDPKVIPLAQSYLNGIAWGVFPLLIFNVLRNYSEALSYTRATILITFLGAVVNVPLDYALIYGKWGFPAYGVQGAAYATSLIQWLMGIAMLCYVWWHPFYKPFSLRKLSLLPDFSKIAVLLKIGVPVGLTWVSELGFFSASTFLIGRIGSEWLAAHQMAFNAISLMFMIPLGLSFAVSIRVGQASGNQDWVGVSGASRAGLYLATGVGGLLALVYLTVPKFIMGIYTTDVKLIELSATFLQIAALFQLCDGLQVVGAAALRGLTDTKVPFYNTLISFWGIGFPVTLVLVYGLNLGAYGVWWGLVIGLAVASLFHLHRLRKTPYRERPWEVAAAA